VEKEADGSDAQPQAVGGRELHKKERMRLASSLLLSSATFSRRRITWKGP